MFHRKTAEAAKGKWRGILKEFGLADKFLKNQHGPCPLCGGKDRYRWDNKEGTGSFFCSGCGSGDGVRLAMRITGNEFKEVADQIDAIVKNVKHDPLGQKTPMSSESVKRNLRSVYGLTSKASKGDLVDKYLQNRGINIGAYPKSLRYSKSLSDGEGGLRPCMVSIVSNFEGVPVTMHRTFLNPSGTAKAEMQSSRKLMPGHVPTGSCIRLSDGTNPDAVLGIAEGIETALSAQALFDIPVWAAINSGMLEKWFVPDWAKKIIIFPDNDVNFCGQASAFKLAHRLYLEGLNVEISMPSNVGDDWNDELLKNRTGYQNDQ